VVAPKPSSKFCFGLRREEELVDYGEVGKVYPTGSSAVSKEQEGSKHQQHPQS